MYQVNIMDQNKDRNNRIKRIIFLYAVPIVILFIIVLSIVFLIYPTYNNIINYNNEISYYNNQNIDLNSKINILKCYSSTEGKAKLNSYLAKLNTIIPNNLQFILTSAKVQSLGQNAGLTFSNLSSEQIPKSFTQQVTIPGLSTNVTPNSVYVSFTGNYAQLKSYISNLIKDKILFTVNDFLYKGDIFGGNNLSNSATMSFNITFYSSPDSSYHTYTGGLISMSSLDKLLANFK